MHCKEVSQKFITFGRPLAIAIEGPRHIIIQYAVISQLYM